MFAPLFRHALRLSASVAVLGLAAGCTSPGSGAASAPSDGKLRGDFGDLQVVGTMAVGEESVVDVSTAAQARSLRGVAFEGTAGAYVKVDVASLEGNTSTPEAVLVGTRDGRAYVVAHGQAPSRGTVYFKLLRDGTHYVAAKDGAARAHTARVRVTEVMPAPAAGRPRVSRIAASAAAFE